MAPRKNMRKRRAPLRKRSAAGKGKTSVSVGVKKYVKKMIHTQIENKSVQINPGPISFGNVLESPDFNAYPCLPCSGIWTINQSVGAGGRVGNIIKVRKVYLNYILYSNIYDAGTNANPSPQEVRLMLGYVKNTPSFPPIAGDIGQLFNSGSTSVAPVGNLKDLISVYNLDYWSIKKSWTHKIGFANNTGTGTNAATQGFSNNDFKLNVYKRLDITKYCVKTCIFNDTSATTNTKNLFFMYYAVRSNGGTSSNIDLPIRIDYTIDFVYEDA